MLIVPQADSITQPYWDGVALRQVRLQHCNECTYAWHPPTPICPNCHSIHHTWRQIIGGGSLYSFTVAHHPVHPAVTDKVPYLIALVNLDEGPRVVSSLRDCEPLAAYIGMRLTLIFEEIAPGVLLPQFRPV